MMGFLKETYSAFKKNDYVKGLNKLGPYVFSAVEPLLFENKQSYAAGHGKPKAEARSPQ